ncbi:hypothetical protein, partial [Francisella philomiragia]
IASMEVVQSLLRFKQSLGQRDMRVLASNALDLLSKGLYLASAIKDVSKVVGVGGSVFATSATTGGASAGFSEGLVVGGRILSLARLGVGLVIPFTNIVSFVAFTVSVAAWAIVYFRSNIYEAWARLSQFANDNNTV